MMPIVKVFSGDNPADLMTKNVGKDLAIKHMKTVGIRFAESRTGAVAKLHMIEQKDTWKIEKQGVNVSMVKVHCISRKELYFLNREESYPVHNGDLEAVRVTTSVAESGKVFEIEDNWRRPGRTSRVLSELWTGQTYFTVRAFARKKVAAAVLAAPNEGLAPGPAK